MSVGVVDKSTGDRIPTAGNPLDKVGNLANLTTTAKGDAVEAINEVNATKANQAQLATVEASATASKAYSANEYLVLGGVLYKVTANIAQGGTIVTEGAGKNVDLATVGGELSAINSNIANVANQIVGVKAGYLSSSSDNTVYIPAKIYPRVLIVLNNQGSTGVDGKPTIVGILSTGLSGAYKFEQITNITDYALTFTYDNTTDPDNPRYAVQYIKVSDSTPQTYLRGFYLTADLRWR